MSSHLISSHLNVIFTHILCSLLSSPLSVYSYDIGLVVFMYTVIRSQNEVAKELVIANEMTASLETLQKKLQLTQKKFRNATAISTVAARHCMWTGQSVTRGQKQFTGRELSNLAFSRPTLSLRLLKRAPCQT